MRSSGPQSVGRIRRRWSPRGEVRLRRRPGAAARRRLRPRLDEDETRQTLENAGTLLERAGSGFEHVVRCGVWLVDLDDFPGMNGVYETFFPGA